jgi:hypothetical protein
LKWLVVVAGWERFGFLDIGTNITWFTARLHTDQPPLSVYFVAILLYTGHSLGLEVVCMQPWVAKGKFCSFFGL